MPYPVASDCTFQDMDHIYRTRMTRRLPEIARHFSHELSLDSLPWWMLLASTVPTPHVSGRDDGYIERLGLSYCIDWYQTPEMFKIDISFSELGAPPVEPDWESKAFLCLQTRDRVFQEYWNRPFEPEDLSLSYWRKNDLYLSIKSI